MVLFPVLFSPAITVIPLISISASAILPIFLTLSFTPLVSSLVYTLMPLWITLQQQISQTYGKSGPSQSYPAVRIYYYCTVFIFELEQDLYRFHMRTNSNYIPTKLWISGQYFYSTNTVRAAFSHKIMDGTNFAPY